MGRPSKDATPCALLNKSVQLYKECDVCREAAEQPRAGLQCARIATGPAAPEFCAPADADRPWRARAAPAAAPEAGHFAINDGAMTATGYMGRSSGAGRHSFASPGTPAGRATSGLSGTTTHILSLAGDGATAQILRGDATTSKPIAQLSKKRKTKTAVTQSATAVLGGVASMIAPVDPDGLLVAVAAHVQTKHARGAQRESDPEKKKKLQTTVVADLSTTANTAMVQRSALDIKGKPHGKAASTCAGSAAADSAADAAKVAVDPAVEVKIGKETIEWASNQKSWRVRRAALSLYCGKGFTRDQLNEQHVDLSVCSQEWSEIQRHAVYPGPGEPIEQLPKVQHTRSRPTRS